METSSFKGYEKIEENIKSYNFSEEQIRLFKKTDWVVTEKIHGANLCVIVNKEGVLYAKRKEILAEDDDFFGYRSVLTPDEFKFISIWEKLNNEITSLESIFIYGELFGGGYPHPEVTPVQEMHLVQTGVYYSPDIHYSIFDIAVKTVDQERQYLDYDKTLQLCKENDLLVTLPLFKGKYNEAFNFNTRFITTWPNYFHLPAIAGNFAEGVVIRPVKNIAFENAKGGVRPLVKVKIEEFSEAKYNQSEKRGPATGGRLEKSKEKAFELITLNRLNNTLSKIGRVKKDDLKRVKKLEEMMMDDVLASLEGMDINIKNLLDYEQKQLRSEILMKIKALISESL